jgi:hypothetical protein
LRDNAKAVLPLVGAVCQRLVKDPVSAADLWVVTREVRDDKACPLAVRLVSLGGASAAQVGLTRPDLLGPMVDTRCAAIAAEHDPRSSVLRTRSATG